VGAGSPGPPGPPGPGDAGDPAAAGLAGPAVLGLLLGLVDQSLVVAEPLPDGTTRYRLLETLRQYAGEALEASGGAEAARARHAAHFLAAVEAADAPPLGPEPGAAAPLWVPEQAAVWRRLGAARDDLRAALGWLLARGDGAAGLRLALALAPFWREFSQREGERWLEALLARRAGAPAALRAGATAAAGHLAGWRGDHARALGLFEAAVALAREQGDRRLLAAALGGLGQALGAPGGPPGRAAALLGESLALHRELGNERGVVGALYALGMLAHFRGEPARAVAHLEEGLAHSRRLGLGAGLIALGLFHLGLLAYLQGQPDRAEGLARQALALRRDLAQAVGRPGGLGGGGMGVCLALLAGVASAQGRAGRAARLFGAAERGAESLQQKVVLPRFRDDYDRAVAAARAALGEDAFAAAWAAGRAMAPEDAVAYALADAPDAA
jgi:tetratricopeptide (TPR) repeat protein